MSAHISGICAECGATMPGVTIDALISALEHITGELEKHTADMNYTGTEEFNVHTFSRHPFDKHTYDALHDLNRRLERVRNDLCSVDDERQDYDALTLGQQKSRTAEFEELAQAAEYEHGSASKATQWAALPPEESGSDR